MGPMNWLGVLLAALAAAGVLALFWRGRMPWGAYALVLLPALMLGHALARIGPDKLAAKPQLYFMQSGGLAIAFVIPALWLTQLRDGVPVRQSMADSLCFLAAYLAMGGVFWVLG